MTMSRKAPVTNRETRKDAEVRGRFEARNRHAQETAREDPCRDQNAIANPANGGLDGICPSPAHGELGLKAIDEEQRRVDRRAYGHPADERSGHIEPAPEKTRQPKSHCKRQPVNYDPQQSEPNRAEGDREQQDEHSR